MTKVKFRAECGPDVDLLMRKCPPGMVIGLVRERLVLDGHLMPDETVLVTLADGYAAPDLKAMMKLCPDGHVIVETLAREEDYTGEREYEE